MLVEGIGMPVEQRLDGGDRRAGLGVRNERMHGHPSLAVWPHHVVERRERVRAQHFRDAVLDFLGSIRLANPAYFPARCGSRRLESFLNEHVQGVLNLLEESSPGECDFRAFFYLIDNRCTGLYDAGKPFGIAEQTFALHAHGLQIRVEGKTFGGEIGARYVAHRGTQRLVSREIE